jgi:hypothetical protein
MSDVDLTSLLPIRGPLPARAVGLLEMLLGAAADLRRRAAAGDVVPGEWQAHGVFVAQTLEDLMLVLPVADVPRAMTLMLLHEYGCPVTVGAWTEKQPNESKPK